MRFTVLAGVLAALALPGAAYGDGARLAPVDVPAADLADATGAAAPSAAAGHVVFSRHVPATGRFELVDWTSAQGLRVLPVGDRAVPFDADVGSGATGGAVLAYSRCAKDGTSSYVLPTVDFTGARGCRPWILDLERDGARPRPLRLAHADGLSLSTPSVHGRSVAAVAAPARGANDARVLLWRRTAQVPRRLHGGTAAKCPYRSCKTAPRTGVDALDLGPSSVAFVWRLTDPPYGAGPGLELRTSSVSAGGSGRQVASGQGYLSGACGFRQPVSPSAAGGGVAFLLAQSPCDDLQTTLAVQRPGATLVSGARPAGVLAFGAAFDGPRVYWLRGAPLPKDAGDSSDQTPVPCAIAGTNCRLVVSRSLPLGRVAGR